MPEIGAVDDLISETVRRGTVRAGTPPAPSPPAAPGASPRPRVTDGEADARLTAQVKKGVAALLDKKAEKLVVLNLAGLTAMSDYFVLATATSDRQSQALADAVEAALKTEGRRPLSVEGYQSGTWILLDYGDVVFHVFHDVARRFYGLERLWGDAPDLTPHFS